MMTPEIEVEKLFKQILPNTRFENKAFAVGGYVRDEVMGLESKDLDIVVEIDKGSEDLAKLLHTMFGESVSTPRQMGANYPIWQITFKENVTRVGRIFETKGAIVEFADTMTESFPDIYSRQRITKFGTLDDDVKRRDFTVNMLLKDLTIGKIIDPSGKGIEDIKEGVIRCHPEVFTDEIFSADPLRMMRMIRFSCKYNWTIDFTTGLSATFMSERIKVVSNERIMEELEKIMKIGKLYEAIKKMDECNLLEHILPEVKALQAIEQAHEATNHHKEGNAYNHTILVLKHAEATVVGQLSALFHDIGKATTQVIEDDKISFLKHEDVGADLTMVIMRRLKYDVDTITKVATLVRNHMRPHHLSRRKASIKAIRKLVREIGEELVHPLLNLSEADCLGNYPVDNTTVLLRERVIEVMNSPIKIRKQPILNGHEIMELLDIKPSPMISKVGKFLLDVEDEMCEDGEELDKELANELVKMRFK